MAKTKISEFDSTPANNTDIDSLNIAEGCAPSGINNAIRELMSQLKDQQTGASSDNFTVGGNLTVTGTTTFTGIPSGPTASVSTDTTQLATTAFVRDIVPSGVILMWSGSIATIPSGWLLCDGTNGTPSLVDKFVVGAGFTYQPGVTGGSANAVVVSHTHTATVTDPTHAHVQTRNDNAGAQQETSVGPSVGTGYATASGGSNPSVSTQSASTGISVSNSTTGVSATNANLPPYYALVYIMKS
jgi:hypothetical protein